jgi:hypothetical protein
MSIIDFFRKGNGDNDEGAVSGNNNIENNNTESNVIDLAERARKREELVEELNGEIKRLSGEYYNEDCGMSEEAFLEQILGYIKSLISDEKIGNSGLSGERLKEIYNFTFEEIKAGTILGAIEEYYTEKVGLEDRLIGDLAGAFTSGGDGRRDPRNDRDAHNRMVNEK